MTTTVMITSPDTNAHNVRVEKVAGDLVQDEHILEPGSSTMLHVHDGVRVIVTETVKKSLEPERG